MEPANSTRSPEGLVDPLHLITPTDKNSSDSGHSQTEISTTTLIDIPPEVVASNSQVNLSASLPGESGPIKQRNTPGPLPNFERRASSLYSLMSDLSIDTCNETIQRPSSGIHSHSSPSGNITYSDAKQLQTPFTAEPAANIPDPSDLILVLNSDCGFDAFFKNLTIILSTYFGAQRISIALPTDPTDIANIPWGLRALWNQAHPLPRTPQFTSTDGDSVRSSLKLHSSHEHDEEDEHWHTDDDNQNDRSNIPTPLIMVTPQPRPEVGRRASFKQKLGKTLGKSNWRAKPPPLLNLKNSSHGVPSPGEEPTASPRTSAKSQTSKAHSSHDPHLMLFDELRTLEWEKDPLIDAQGVVNVLDIDQMVMLQRKYVQPINEKASFIDSEQVLFSPWARSPVPSPAVREYTQTPFFAKKSTSDELFSAFESPSGSPTKFSTTPIDAIGFEDTYTLIHLLLVAPSFSSQRSTLDPYPGKNRSAPVAILSFLSSLIPFPNDLRTILNKLTPHIASSFIQARAHSALSNQVEACLKYQTCRSGDVSSLSVGNNRHQKTPSSPYYTAFPPTRSHVRRRTKVRKGRASSSLPVTDVPVGDIRKLDLKRKVYYSSLQDDKPTADTTSSEHRYKFPFHRRRIRPKFKRFLYSTNRQYKSDKYSVDNQEDEYDMPINHNKVSRDGPADTSINSSSTSFSSSGSPEIRLHGTDGDINANVEMSNPSNKLLRTIIDAIPVHVFTAEPVNGRISWASNRTLTFRGLTASDFCRDPLSSIHEDDQADYSDAWAKALRNSTPLGHMFRVRRFDGRYRAFFLRAVPLRDERGSVAHWFCTMMDIHNKHESEVAALQLAHDTAWEQKYKILAESTPIIVFTTNSANGMIYVNQKWFDYSGLSARETLGFQYLSAIHPEDRERALLPLNENGGIDIEKFRGMEYRDGTYCVEMRIRNKQGQYRWHLTMFTCSGNMGSRDAIWFGTSTDIQDQKMIQQKLKEAKDAAQRTIESKTRFLSNMSHEIRTPLIGISGMVSFLLDTPLSEEQLDYCHTISSSSEALLMVINDILDLSKVESGKMTLQYTWFFVRRLVEEVNELLSSMAISKNLELNSTIAHDVPMWVKGDRVRLRQVILNLIGNAIKFTDKGEIYTYCSVGSVSEDGSSMMLKVEVHDTGRGFTPEDAAKRMFKPYSQIGTYTASDGVAVMPAGGDTTAGTSGTGLGLVISRQLIELHGGELNCEGEKGKGSVFRFTAKVMLPMADDHPSKEELKKHEQLSLNTDGPWKKNQSSEVALQILVVCPWRYTCRSIEHHIRATLQDPGACEIKFEDGFTGLVDILEKSEECKKKWTHVVLNINDVKEVMSMLDYLTHAPAAIDSHLIVLISPLQRQALMKYPGEKLENGTPVTYLPKPLKPSRYSVVFDPNRKREESRDIKMQSAQNALVAQRTVFDDLMNFAAGKNYQFLLAEDNLVNQKVMTKFFSRAGIACQVATDGEACTDLFFACKHDFDLILCDLDMPRKDGFQVCEEIRAWERANAKKPIPIVALSAYVMSDVAEKCNQAGFDRYISKPVEFGYLKDAIIEVLAVEEK